MADVRLDFYDLDDEVPARRVHEVRSAAGRAADEDVLLGPLLGAHHPLRLIIFMKRRRVPIPLCERHKNHWMIRYLVGFGGLALLLLLLFGGIFLLVMQRRPRQPAHDALMARRDSSSWPARASSFLAWLITLIVLAVTQINVFEITDDDIALKNISPEFADAYREQTRRRPRRGRPGSRPVGAARAGRRTPTTTRDAADGRTCRRTTNTPAAERKGGPHGRPADRHAGHQGRRVRLRPRPAARPGVDVLVLDAGVLRPPAFPPDVPREQVFAAAGEDLEALRKAGDRGRAVEAAAQGAARVARDLHRQGRVDAVLGLGGSAGTAIGTAAMRALPFGVPKLMVSTMASGQVRPYVGQSDVCMMYSVVDVSGLNRISRRVLANAAAAVAGMVRGRRRAAAGGEDRPLIAATMFGVTTPCVDAARARWSRPATKPSSSTPPARAAGRWRRSSPRARSPASST